MKSKYLRKIIDFNVTDNGRHLESHQRLYIGGDFIGDCNQRQMIPGDPPPKRNRFVKLSCGHVLKTNGLEKERACEVCRHNARTTEEKLPAKKESTP